MMGFALSAAGAGLLRALIRRCDIARERVLIVRFRSVDWQSLTFIGERHELELRIAGPDAAAALARLTDDLPDCDLAVPGQTVADILVVGTPQWNADASATVRLEALTIAH